ncbi:MAG: hypothetical protein RMK29_21375 [Myxococcales bacterium]|nr:hypothetical protein [Myxococcota bacterium]MDW8284263.1 hypothetical protein [Myxococcales bacterium]
MRAHLAAGFLLLASSCTFSIEQLVPTTGGVPFTPVYGRAYFIKKSWLGSRVLVCDVQQATGNVLCYESGEGLR